MESVFIPGIFSGDLATETTPQVADDVNYANRRFILSYNQIGGIRLR